MKCIPLTQGKVAVVDDCDYEYLNQWRWYYMRKCGYAARTVQVNKKRRMIYMHHVVCERKGAVITDQCDHRDRDKLNNRRRNLRPATKIQNMRNRGPTSRSVSGHKGVYWDAPSNKWCVKIKVGDKNMHLGYFTNLDEAVTVRRRAERRYFKEFAHQ